MSIAVNLFWQTRQVACQARPFIPVAVRMVYQTAKAVNVPIIGMGGIMNADDAIEMILAGATAVSVGTANFTDPTVTEKIVAGIGEYMKKYHVNDIKELIGAVS